MLHAVTMRPATTGPIIHESVSTVTTSELALTSSSSGTRFGIAAFAAGRKKPVAIPDTAASATRLAHAVDERQGGEDAEAHEVRGDHEPSARESIDERAEQEPDHDDREEVRDEERGDPDPRLGVVPDLERQCDGGEIRAEARPCGRKEEVSEGRRPAKKAETA